MKIDPENITNFTSSTYQLQGTLLFWVLAAGKNSIAAANTLEKFLEGSGKPFCHIREKYSLFKVNQLIQDLKEAGAGCYNSKAQTFYELAHTRPNLQTVTLDELMDFHGIGPKTARCFLIHSRKDARYAGLDTHVLRWMRLHGLDTPRNTPSGKAYLIWERKFFELKDKIAPNTPVAEFDLAIWNNKGESHE